MAWTEESLRGQFGGMADFVRPGVLSGSVDEVVERVGEYVEAGADQVNLALRAPFDVDALEQFAAACCRRERSAVSELVRAPGRVNLIGDHTDYTGGLVFPMAIDRWTEITYVEGGSRVELTSTGELDPTSFELPVAGDPAAVAPGWGRYVAAVAAELRATTGIRGTVSTTIPVGAGLSSSAALEVAAAMALGHRGSPLDLARLGQRAEHRATGVPTGIMDQLCIASAVEGHALLIDCSTFDVTPSPGSRTTSRSSSASSPNARSRAPSTASGWRNARPPRP